jgi:hypothetical protein
MDFSPASTGHTRGSAAADVRCRFVLADLREEALDAGFDLVMMIYGQFNVFPRHQGVKILEKVQAALAPGGRLLLELQSVAQIRRDADKGPSWYSAPSGLSSDTPLLVLQENYWDAEAEASTTRFMVIDARTGSAEGYALSNEASTGTELDEALRTAGFGQVQRFPSLTGSAPTEGPDLPVVVARR